MTLQHKMRINEVIKKLEDSKEALFYLKEDKRIMRASDYSLPSLLTLAEGTLEKTIYSLYHVLYLKEDEIEKLGVEFVDPPKKKKEKEKANA